MKYGYWDTVTADLITQKAATGLRGRGNIQREDVGQREDLLCAWNRSRFHRAIQNGAPFKSYEFFIFEIFISCFRTMVDLDHGNYPKQNHR